MTNSPVPSPASPAPSPESCTTSQLIPPPIHPDPTRIIVPRKHGQILIEPPLAKLAPALTPPPAPRSTPLLTELFGQDFPTLRLAAKKTLLHAAHVWAQQTASPPPPADALTRPFILTGHQVEFYHAGVWAKVIAADELARRTNAVPFDLLVDHDVIDHLGFEVPTLADSHWSKTLLQYAPPSPALPAQFLSAPTPSQFTAWDEQLARHPASQTDTLAHLLASLNPSHSSFSYVPWLSAARAKLERALGLNVHHVPTSLLCQTDPWFHFVTAWLQNAPAWTLAYNSHLAAYRRRQNITSPQHPMPDLIRDPDRIELPFWIYLPNSPRSRLFLQPASSTNPQPSLDCAGQKIPLSPEVFTPGPQSAQALRQLLSFQHSEFSIQHSPSTQSSERGGLSTPHFSILPRALTLTMFARLFLSDVFLHGIGGALYDQITDALLLELFNLLPPYACVSAAWLLPLGQAHEQTTTLAELRHHRHHLLHNPQLAINPFTALHTDIAELLQARRDLITNLANSLKNHRTTERQLRRDQFRQLHTLNQTLHQKVPRILQSLDEETAQLEETQRQNKVLLNREYFFALHTLDSLTQLITTLRAM